MASPRRVWQRIGRGARPTSFLTRTATDDAAQLLRRTSIPDLSTYGSIQRSNADTVAASTSAQEIPVGSGDGTQDKSDPLDDNTHLDRLWRWPGSTTTRTSSRRPLKENVRSPNRKGEVVLRPVGGTEKLDTLTGVFIPTTLNVFSILMFIRFGFILGQAGVLGTMGMLIVAYIINLFTALSISAIASNGIVRGGGSYYLISRSLGPEFGGSIGIISYLGFVFNTGMNAVGLVDCLTYNFGADTGIWANWLPEGTWWTYMWSTVILCVCVAVCLAGSALLARASTGLLIILMISIFSIPVSALVKSPFTATEGRQYTDFTGFSLNTFKENLMPRLTRGAAGSQIKGRENFQDLFGILFPATGGIFAGASMSGALKNPSKSIPQGTLGGIFTTFIVYTIVILAMGASITRATFYQNLNVVQDVSLSEVLILLGEVATSLFSVLMGIIGPAAQLQAIARDQIVPGLDIFGQGTGKSDSPILGVLVTWIVAQFTILFNINDIASLVTMSYLMMNLSLHMACLLLKLSSAPNFRPSFRFFNQYTALIGALLSIGSMFFIDSKAASGAIVLLILFFLLIHYTTPPKTWGSDVTSGLVYHQVRKYLLRLKTEHVKYWRPQILLFVNDPRRGYKLISFANSLKKGGLFILGHVIVTDNFGASVPEARRQQAAWTKYIEYMKIKSFVNVAISPSIEWGARNIILSAGLGGMRPNIVMMGFYNLEQFRQEQPLVDIPSPPPERKQVKKRRRASLDVRGALPTDVCVVEKRTDIQSYVLTLEDMILKLKTNVALAVGFHDLELPNLAEGNMRKYIDLWPIQMSAEIPFDDNGKQKNATTTNFDTYTLILQLGCILNTVHAWKKCFKLRVAVFVEYESDVEEERQRVKSLLESLRIEAEVLVFWLAGGDLKSYNVIVNGSDADEESEEQINKILEDDEWWKELSEARGRTAADGVSMVDASSLAPDDMSAWAAGSYPRGGRDLSAVRFDGLRRLLQESRTKASFGNLSRLGVSLNIRTHRLDDDLLSRHTSDPSGSEFDSHDSHDEHSSDDDRSHEAYDGSDEELDDIRDTSETEFKNNSQERSSLPSNPNSKSGEPSSKRGSFASSKRSKASSKKRRLSLRDSLIQDMLSKQQAHADNIDNAERLMEEEAVRGRRPFRAAQNGDSSTQPSSPALTDPAGSSKKSRNASPNFISSPVPLTRIASDEGQGPSIMFVEDPHPRRHVKVEQAIADANARSIYQRNFDDSQSRTRAAGGYPSGAAVPLSFNDVPCRAQHLILNELMMQNSDETAVIFTTLPAPSDGTYRNESESLTYLTDLEVLTQGLGPVLLVHSNSMTVTTNL